MYGVACEGRLRSEVPKMSVMAVHDPVLIRMYRPFCSKLKAGLANSIELITKIFYDLLLR